MLVTSDMGELNVVKNFLSPLNKDAFYKVGKLLEIYESYGLSHGHTEQTNYFEVWNDLSKQLQNKCTFRIAFMEGMHRAALSSCFLWDISISKKLNLMDAELPCTVVYKIQNKKSEMHKLFSTKVFPLQADVSLQEYRYYSFSNHGDQSKKISRSVYDDQKQFIQTDRHVGVLPMSDLYKMMPVPSLKTKIKKLLEGKYRME